MFEVKLNPMFGAAAMSLSSIFVVGNALRLKGFKSTFRQADDKKGVERTESIGSGESREHMEETRSAEERAGAKEAQLTEERTGAKEVQLAEERAGVKETRSEEEKACMESMETTETITTEREKMMEKLMKIDGMMCAHCTGRVQKALEAVEGVSAVTMSLEEKTALVALKAEVADEALTAAVTDAGYEVKEITAM